MSYRDFTLPDVVDRFSLVVREGTGLFADRPPIQPSALLVETLRINLPLAVAISNEKVRSELVVAPVLLELKRLQPDAIGFFSGVELSVEPSAGLTGTCGFFLSRTPGQFYVRAPIVMPVEVTRGDLIGGVGPCVAEMVAARMFNERAKSAIETVYGAVTSGASWWFLSLSGTTVSVDFDGYSIRELDKVLGILVSMIKAPASV